MKNIFKNIYKILLVALISLLLAVPAVAQDPPPPPPGHGETGNVPGGGAPVGSGLLILSLLGAAYGIRKWQQHTKNAE